MLLLMEGKFGGKRRGEHTTSPVFRSIGKAAGLNLRGEEAGEARATCVNRL